MLLAERGQAKRVQRLSGWVDEQEGLHRSTVISHATLAMAASNHALVSHAEQSPWRSHASTVGAPLTCVILAVFSSLVSRLPTNRRKAWVIICRC